METQLTPQEIGRRLAGLRRTKGFSQEDLAAGIGISRPSLAQIELGNRNINVIELQKLSQFLSFSVDVLLSPGSGQSTERPAQLPVPAEKNELRVSVPELDRDKFKNVLLYILEQCAGKPNLGETALYKLLYFCDFNYYELYEEHLTGARYRKLPFGPVPLDADGIISEMIENSELKRFKTNYHGFPQTRFIPLIKADLTQLSAAGIKVIEGVLRQMSDWNATTISEYSHKDMPWLATDNGSTISYNLAFYRELPYSVRVYDERE